MHGAIDYYALIQDFDFTTFQCKFFVIVFFLFNKTKQAPVPKAPWKHELHTIEDPNKCTQRDPFRRDIEIEGSEDCLYINVYTPSSDRVNSFT